MRAEGTDEKRGARLRDILKVRGRGKLMALAAELGVSPAAVSKWVRGAPMSVTHACRLADSLDISLDWLLLGRRSPDRSTTQIVRADVGTLIELLHDRPADVTPSLVNLVSMIPARS